MAFEDHKVVIYRNQPEDWVAEIAAIPGCHALMSTAEEAAAELANVFQMIEDEYRSSGRALPRNTKKTTKS